MVYTDWNNYGTADEDIEIDSTFSRRGQNSLHFMDTGWNAAKINPKVKIEPGLQVDGARVVSYVYMGADASISARIFDEDTSGPEPFYTEFVSAGVRVSDTTGNLTAFIEGSYENTEEIVTGNWGDFTLSDGTTAPNRWLKLRIDIYKIQNTTYAEFYEDASVNGVWTQIGNRIAAPRDDNAESLSYVVGVGGSHEGVQSAQAEMWLDDTELYYP